MTGGMYGADVEQLRSLAMKFEDSGSNLLDVIRTLDHQINSTGAWRGPDAERFRSDWNGRDKTALTNSANSLQQGASTLRRNGEEQERASAGGGGSALGGGSSAHRASPTSAGLPVAAGGGAVVDGPALIELYHNLRQLQFGGLTISDQALVAAKIAGTGMLDKVGTVADVADVIGYVHRGEWGDAASVVSKTVGDSIKNIPGPVAYLSGTAINVWTDVFVQAGKSDWSAEGRSEVSNYMAQDPWGAADAAIGSVMNYLPTLVSDVWPGKLKLGTP